MKKTIKTLSLMMALIGLTHISFAGNSEDLLAACKKSDVAAAQKAITAGADVNFKDADGWTPLAAAFFSPEITKLLLDKKADPNGGNAMAMSNAAATGSIEVIKLLLAAGADPNKPLVIDPSAGMQKALDAEKAKGKAANKYIVKAYEDQLKGMKDAGGIKLFPAERVVKSTLCTECLQLLIEKGAKVDMISPTSKTNLLHEYAAAGLSPADWIVNNQAQVGGWEKMGFVLPAWFSKPDVAKLGTPDAMVKILVKAGVNINAENAAKKTPVQDLILNRKLAKSSEVVMAFTNNGAKIEKGDVLEFEKKTAKLEDIDVDFDFPSEGRNNDNGNGYSANVDLLNPKPKKIGLISFYVYDPGSGKSSNGTFTGVASSAAWCTTNEVAEAQATGFYQTGIDALRTSFKNYNMELLTPDQFLNSEEKKKFYDDFDEETSGLHTEKTKVAAASAYTTSVVGNTKMCPKAKGFRYFFVSNEPMNNPVYGGNFANTGVFGSNRKMTSSLGHDLCKALNLDAVIVCYIVSYKEDINKHNYKVGAVSMYMFGPNPKSEGSDDKNRGQFYCGTRVYYKSPLEFQTLTNSTYEGFQNIMTAMGNKTANWVVNKKK